MSHEWPERVAAPDPLRHAPWSARMVRLAVKELRETLRDRRTLLTLVLMPFLLYPLLSLVLRKFLLTGALGGTLTVFHLGFDTERDANFVGAVMTRAQEIRAARQKSNSLAEPLPELRGGKTEDSEEALRNGDIDVIIRITKYPPEKPQPNESWEVDCELVRLEGSLNGERAARYVEDCLRTYGNLVIGSRMRSAGIRQRATPVRVEQKRIAGANSAGVVSLPALVPFVLILMTITGAVYPAIDLTAGERERGTLELLIAAPVPRLALLFAKYVAVLTVATLTACINLVAMTGTVLFSGLGSMLWGEKGLSLGTVVAVFLLLLLLAGFFSALLLTITSFAHSFKEAQAYLIPVMLCALGPGLISLMPGVELRGWLVVTPLLNVALLSRDILNGSASLVVSLVVVASTVLYAIAALALAARLFAAEAVLYDARLGWAEMWRRPPSEGMPDIASALFCLACMFPLSFAANGVIGTLPGVGISGKLAAMTLATALIFGGVPWAFGRWFRVSWERAFQWRIPSSMSLLGAAWLGLFLWPFAHELIVGANDLHLISIDKEQLERARPFIEQTRTVPVWLVVMAFALAPAVFEEFCFRGLVFSAFRRRMAPWSAILSSAALFGIFHLVALDSLAVERLLPSTLLGIVLGWVCYRTDSLFPGMILHAFHNGFLALLIYFLPRLQAAGWGTEEQRHLPPRWLLCALGGAVIGWLVVYLSTRRPSRVDI